VIKKCRLRCFAHVECMLNDECGLTMEIARTREKKEDLVRLSQAVCDEFWPVQVRHQ